MNVQSYVTVSEMNVSDLRSENSHERLGYVVLERVVSVSSLSERE